MSLSPSSSNLTSLFTQSISADLEGLNRIERSPPFYPYPYPLKNGRNPSNYNPMFSQSRVSPPFHDLSLGRKPFPAIPKPLSMSRMRQKPFHPPSQSLSSIFDPLGFFSSSGVVKKSSRIQNRSGYAPATTTTTTTTTTEAPSLVYIPDGSQGECGDYQEGGFNTYSFIGFLLGVVNIVAQVANNVNNNLNNNNNNNQNNNNNLGNINAAGSNSNQNNDNTVMIPAGMGGRKRRTVDGRVVIEKDETDIVQSEEEAIAAAVALPFMRGYVMLSKSSEECFTRIICQANSEAVQSSVTPTNRSLAKVFAEIYTLGLIEWSPVDLTMLDVADVGSKGRNGQRCPLCPEKKWQDLLKETEKELALDLGFQNRENDMKDFTELTDEFSENLKLFQTAPLLKTNSI